MKKLKELRKKKGLSQAKLAKLINVAQPQVSAWENGRTPSIGSLERLAKALGVKPGELL
jgi:transcriptional regulator with XRE-family HTH domain